MESMSSSLLAQERLLFRAHARAGEVRCLVHSVWDSRGRHHILHITTYITTEPHCNHAVGLSPRPSPVAGGLALYLHHDHREREREREREGEKREKRERKERKERDREIYCRDIGIY